MIRGNANRSTGHLLMNDISHQDDFLPLDEALNFTAEDLDANRDGRLSKRQTARLRARNGFGLIIGNLLVLALVGGGLWIVTLGSAVTGSLLVMAGGGLFVLSRRGRGDYVAAVDAGAVDTETGALTLDTRDYKNPNGVMTEYLVTVGTETFVVSQDAYIAFSETPAERFTVYYLPGARILLSAEAHPA
jgi:hypothetical protein